VFVLDISGSIGSKDVQKIKEFIKQMADIVDIGPNKTLFSVVLFARHAWIDFTLDTHTTKEDLKDAINEIIYDNKGGTNISKALNFIRVAGENGSLGIRNDSQFKTAIVMTDGRLKPNKTDDQHNTNVTAINLLNSGVYDRVFAIGIHGKHGIHNETLKFIASPKSVFVMNENIFEDFRLEVEEAFCTSKKILVLLITQEYTSIP